jgi:hypothetical protein
MMMREDSFHRSARANDTNNMKSDSELFIYLN